MYIQIIHVYGNHWITVTNIDGTKRKNGVTKERVLRYDSLLSKKLNLNTMKQICGMVRPVSSRLRFDTMNIMKQPNLKDCGLFSIACSTELVFGNNPGKCHWNTKEMLRHLMVCFEQRKMQRFPLAKERRFPFGSAVAFSTVEEILCSCRMPYDKNIDMIECVGCMSWYHNSCVGIKEVSDFQDKKWLCGKCELLFGTN